MAVGCRSALRRSPQGIRVQVAEGLDPVLVGPHGHSPDRLQAADPLWGAADDVPALLEFPVDPLGNTHSGIQAPPYFYRKTFNPEQEQQERHAQFPARLAHRDVTA